MPPLSDLEGWRSTVVLTTALDTEAESGEVSQTAREEAVTAPTLRVCRWRKSS